MIGSRRKKKLLNARGTLDVNYFGFEKVGDNNWEQK